MKGSAEDSGAKSDESDSEGDGEREGAETSAKNEAEDKHDEAGETDKGDTEQKAAPNKKQQEMLSRRMRDRMVERIQFVCSLCKFRTFYSEEMSSHLQSDFHKEHYHFVAGKLPKQSADFLQEYISHKTKKTEERRNVVDDLGTTIQQIFRDQDLTQDLGMEHFVKKVEAAHCAACDMFIPMNFSALQRHVRTPLHNQNRRTMMENSKKMALVASRSILNNKLISQKLERYIKGQNPFVEEPNEATGGGGGSSAGLEAPKGQEVTDAADGEDLQARNSSAAAAPGTVSSEDASDRNVAGDGEMCASEDQEEFTHSEIIGGPRETSEDAEMKC